MPDAVAAFDFDGTITRRDTLLPFLRRVCGAQKLSAAVLANGLDLAAMLAGRVARDEVKERLLSDVLAGRSAAEVEATAHRYARELQGGRQLRPTMVARIEQHRAAGHALVLVSASPALYLDPLGAILGFDAVLATRLEVEGGCLTGRFEGANCRGAEKVLRLEDWLGGREVRLWAYGDSAGDEDLLALADVPHRVGRGPLPPIAD